MQNDDKKSPHIYISIYKHIKMWTLFVVVLLLQFIKRLWFPPSTSKRYLIFGELILLRICSRTQDIHIPMLKLESTKKGFQYAGIKAWNDMPLSIRELSSLSLFKSHLKKHFMRNENVCPLKEQLPVRSALLFSTTVVNYT